MKSVLSPGFPHHNGQFNKFNPSQSTTGQNGNPVMASSHNGAEFINCQKDDFDTDFHQSYIHSKSAITPLINKPTILLNGNTSSNFQPKPPTYIHQAVAENYSKYYVYQSPVFKISFSSKNQIERFFDSEFNKDFIDDFSFQSCGSKQIYPKFQDQEIDNRSGSYKRVIQFNDENEDELNENEYLKGYSQTNERHSKKNGASFVLKNPIKKGDGLSHKQVNLFEEQAFQGSSAVFDSQNTQMTFNPYNNSQNHSINDNATTVKKAADSQVSSQDLTPTVQKQQQQQKRKLYESPQLKEDRDLHTPSTKKKSSSLLIGSQPPQFNNHVSNKKKESKVEQKKLTKKEKLLLSQKAESNLLASQKKQETTELESIKKTPLNEKLAAEKKDDHEEEDREEKSEHSSENSQNNAFTRHSSSAKPSVSQEEKKICCNCKRTKCLKLYCECFANSKTCEGCTCQGCFNKPEFESMRKEARMAIKERNISAFEPKIDSQSKLKQLCNEDSVHSEQKVHSKGCNCKKSNCLKKYCECYQLGVKCTKLCKCDNCKNNISHSHHSNDEPDSRINTTPTAQNILASTGKINPLRSSANGVSLSQNEYSQYNQYNYYCQDNYYPYYYQYPYAGYPYYGDYYMYHPEEHNENSAGAPINIPPQHHGHPEQYGYEHYNHPPPMMHPSQYKENIRSMKKYPHQYSQQMHQYNMQFEGSMSTSNRGTKKALLNNQQQDEQQIDNQSFYQMPQPEKKKKANEDASKKINEDPSLSQKENNEQSSLQISKEASEQQNSKLMISPRFKEASNNEFCEEAQSQTKKEEQLPKSKESKEQKVKGDTDKSKEKHEEGQQQLLSTNEDLEEEQQQPQKKASSQEKEDVEEKQAATENDDNQEDQSSNDIPKEDEKVTNSKSKSSTSNKKTKKISKKEDPKKKQTNKKESPVQPPISRSPHNTRKNQKETQQKASVEKSKSSSKKAAAAPTPAKKSERKEKKEIKSPKVEETQEKNIQGSVNSKRSSSKKRQKNANA